MAASKHFQTSKENQTAPVLNNASIYRAGQNPNKKDIVSDDEDANMVTNSYFLSGKLQSNQQPTFVDALKHRFDPSGRIVTRSQLLKTKKPTNKSTSPIKKPINKPTNSHTTSASSTPKSNSNLKSQPISNDNASDDSSDDSSDDFDMNNLQNLTVPTVETNIAPINESDDIRQKLKQHLQLEKQQELQSAPVIIQPHHTNPTELSSGSSSDYETASSSESEDDRQPTRLNPRKRKIQFLSKKQRDNASSVALDEETVRFEEFEQQRNETRKQETRQYALDYIREQEKQRQDAEGDQSDAELPDDNDDGDGDMQEFELWKLREIRRNLRDENARRQREKEKHELLARRKMSDAEIVAENERLGLHKEKKSGNMKFMQKYYHSGVFYRDGSIVESGVLDRNFNAPTGQDKYIDFDRVPDAMKTKNFGKMSQSKWTHLANEDTTFDKEDREWFKKKKSGFTGLNVAEREKMNKDRYRFRHKANENGFWFNRAGTGSFDRPSYKNRNVNNSDNTRFEKKTFQNKNDNEWDRDRMRKRKDRKTR